jgi:hypothetical protein
LHAVGFFRQITSFLFAGNGSDGINRTSPAFLGFKLYGPDRVPAVVPVFRGRKRLIDRRFKLGYRIFLAKALDIN